MAKEIVYFDPTNRVRAPERLWLPDTVAAAFVRGGIAAAANPSDTAALQAGGGLSADTIVEISLQHGIVGQSLGRFRVPLAVAQIAAGAGVAAPVNGVLPPLVVPPVEELVRTPDAIGAFAQTVYVAPGGLAGNAGTEESPKDLWSLLLLPDGTANTALVDNTLIYLLPGRYSKRRAAAVAGDWHLPVPAKKITFWGRFRGAMVADPLGDGLPVESRFQRIVIIDALLNWPVGGNYEMAYIDRTARDCLTGYPDPATQTWQDVGLGPDSQFNMALDRSEGADGYFHHCGWFVGRGVNQEPFDPAAKYPEMNTPAWFLKDVDGRRRIAATTAGTAGAYPGWGDATWLPFNPLVNGPAAVGKRWRHLRLEHNHGRDMSSMFPIAIASGGSLRACYNWLERTAIDFFQWGLDDPATTPGPIVLHGNLTRDIIGHAKDNGNPHNDFTQGYSDKTGGTVTEPLRLLGWEMNNNAYVPHPQTRGQPQLGFWQTSSDHQTFKKAILVGQKKRNNIFIGGYKALIDEGSRDPYVVSNIALNPPDLLPGESDMANIQLLRYRYGKRNPPTDNTIVLLADAGKSRGLVADSIYEAIDIQNGAQLIDTAAVGFKGASMAYTQVFQGAITLAAGYATPHAWYEALKRLPAHAAKGPQYPNLRAMLTAPIDFTGERPWIGFLPDGNLAPSVQVLSNLAYIHGGDEGDVLAMTGLTAGAEWRILDKDGVTALTAWSSATFGNLPVNRFMQLRATTAATAATPRNIQFGVGSYLMRWTITTASVNAYPDAVAPADARLRVLNSTSMGLSNSKTAWFYWKGKLPPADGTTKFLMAGFTGSGFLGQVTFNTDDKFRVSFASPGGAVTAGTSVASSGVPKATAPRGQMVELLVAVNLNETTWTVGFQMYQRIGGQTGTWEDIKPASGGAWLPAGEIDFTRTGTNSHLYFMGNASTYAGGELHALALGQDVLDLSTAATLDAVLANFGPDTIGETFKGATGLQPLWAFVGQAAQLNSASHNLGSARPAAKEGAGSFTAGASQQWPVPLTTIIEIDPGPYTVGQAIHGVVRPLGYASAGSTVTLSRTGAAGAFAAASVAMPEGTAGAAFTFTPSAAGSVTISADVSGIHLDPAAETISIN